MTGLAGRITVNPGVARRSLETVDLQHLAADAGRRQHALGLPVHAADVRRPSPIRRRPGLGSAAQPFKGTISNYLQQFISQQGNAATSATQLQQGQSVVVNTLQQKFNSTSSVNIDTEMANLIQVQNTYAANAHIMSVVQSMMQTLAAGSSCKAIKMSISSINYGSFSARSVRAEHQQPAVEPVDAARRAARSRPNYSGMGVNEGFAIAARSQLANISAFGDTMTNVNTDHQRGQHRVAVAVADRRARCRATRRPRRRT